MTDGRARALENLLSASAARQTDGRFFDRATGVGDR
jgi:hypothetical protein